jgi:hypothetical protein
LLSDKYLLDYLKEWSEVYLSHPDVINIQNVVDLFHVAHGCNAAQLKAVCVFQMAQVFDVVQEMEEWKSLPESLKRDFRKEIDVNVRK